ncbi:MAG: hypothetical protein IPK19_25960 [Chloroflexi bacterium]|nr:hypothetical protein [Chloroflexota bacterium]
MLSADERDRLGILRDRIKALEYEYRLPADQPTRRDEQTISRELGEKSRRCAA